MNPSPLILKSYAVLELQLATNLAFNPKAPVDLSMEDFRVDLDVAPSTRPEDQWQVVLRVQQLANPRRNYTYAFAVRMIGFMDFQAHVPEGVRQDLLRVNGASLLYSAAREIIRSTTSNGPYRPLLLPTISFAAGEQGKS